MKKGFTLVELLAVIAILSILALVTVPSVVGNINKSKQNAYNDSIDAVEKAAKDYMASLNHSNLLNNRLTTSQGLKIYISELKCEGLLDDKKYKIDSSTCQNILASTDSYHELLDEKTYEEYAKGEGNYLANPCSSTPINGYILVKNINNKITYEYKSISEKEECRINS